MLRTLQTTDSLNNVTMKVNNSEKHQHSWFKDSTDHINCFSQQFNQLNDSYFVHFASFTNHNRPWQDILSTCFCYCFPVDALFSLDNLDTFIERVLTSFTTFGISFPAIYYLKLEEVKIGLHNCSIWLGLLMSILEANGPLAQV